ncbi:transglycosylase domain-containing protein [Haloferula sargassicola]|uniref:peptidoglycan glycosyltransferase n=1 Tax=Haloferula sargassicola TaxID=490096 RepID=A0ABP9UUG2_9BACT
MAKRKSNEETPASSNRRRKPERKRHGLGTLVLLWPFFLLQRLTAGLPLPVRWGLRAIGHPIVLGLYAAIPMVLFYYARARNYDMAKVSEMPERSIVLDRHGEEIGRIHGEKRDIIGYSDISLDFIYAIVAREDERFFTHHGVDWIGFGRAMLRNLKDRGMTQGASTLTMQLARNSYPLYASWLDFSSPLQELDRKFLELAVSYRIEANYSKEEILQHYVNRIFWGHTIRGIEEASRTYFEKSAKDLDLSEAAMLAGIVRGPNAFSPFRDLSDAIRERNTTLDRMVIAKFITPEEAEAAKAEEIPIRPEWRRVFHDSWAMDSVRRELERVLEEEHIEFGGLQITTTIDLAIQNKAEEALNRHLRTFERRAGYPHETRAAWQEKPEPRPNPAYLQGSLVVIENMTGAIVATIGGRDADESKFNRATQAKRQIGSTFKPFVYAAAFEDGLRPDAMISDDRLARGEVRGAKNWSPHNSDGSFLGYQPVEVGLIRSRNTMSVRVGDYAGMDHVAEIANAVGFEQPMQMSPVSFLGTLEASPEEVASAYTVFPNGGRRWPPRLISEIRRHDGTLVYPDPDQERIISYQPLMGDAASTTARILGKVMDRGTGAAVKRLGFTSPCGGKTGTTDDYKDAWFTGFTSSLTCSVWVGFDQPKTIFDRAYGSTMALPVWVDVMKTAERLGYKATGLSSTEPFTEARVCRTSGKRATQGCEVAGTAYTESLPADQLPAEGDFCHEHDDVLAESLDKVLKAKVVDPSEAELEAAPKARPVEGEAVPKALPVEEEKIPRAVPVD